MFKELPSLNKSPTFLPEIIKKHQKSSSNKENDSVYLQKLKQPSYVIFQNLKVSKTGRKSPGPGKN